MTASQIHSTLVTDNCHVVRSVSGTWLLVVGYSKMIDDPSTMCLCPHDVICADHVFEFETEAAADSAKRIYGKEYKCVSQESIFDSDDIIRFT